VTGSGHHRVVTERCTSPGDTVPHVCLPNTSGIIAAVKRLVARHDDVSIVAEIVRRTNAGIGVERRTRRGRLR
jgi:hypothetical protein